MYELMQRICVGAYVVGYQLAHDKKVIYTTRAEANKLGKDGLIKGVSYNKKADTLRGISIKLSHVPKKTVDKADLPLPTISLDLFLESQLHSTYKDILRGIILHRIYKSTSELGSFEVDFSLVDTAPNSTWVETAYREGLTVCRSRSNRHLNFQAPTQIRDMQYCTFYRVSRQQFIDFLPLINCVYYGVSNVEGKSINCLLDYKSLSGSLCCQYEVNAPQFDYLTLSPTIPGSMLYEVSDIIYKVKRSIRKLNYNIALSRRGLGIELIDTWPNIKHIS